MALGLVAMVEPIKEGKSLGMSGRNCHGIMPIMLGNLTIAGLETVLMSTVREEVSTK